jgi:hypothetical protein
MRLAIYATPTVLPLEYIDGLSEYINGMPHLRGYPLGGLKPPDFPKIVESTAKAHAADATATPPVVQAALGAAYAPSPCAVPPLAVRALCGRRIKRYFADLPLGYTAWANAIAATSAP